jgi:predicted DNA-binding transcriptional regulator YafY
LAKEHDTLATRLSLILTKLNNGERFTIEELSEEFNVGKRTLQRDIKERLSYLPIKKDGTYYFLEEYYLGKLNFNDIKNFAALSGIKHLFPSLEENFLKSVLDDVVKSAYLIKGHNYIDTSSMKELFKTLEAAILGRKQVNFTYKAKQRTVEPYKLLNNKGIWYLAGVEDGKLKTFSLIKISKCDISDVSFGYKDEIIQTLEKEDNIWFSSEQFEVILKIDKEVAGYFQRRKIIPNQLIVKELEDGGVLVSTMVGHFNQILPIVRYWIPNVTIVSPEGLQGQLEDGLREYLKGKY